MNNWLLVLKYKDGRIFLSEHHTSKACELKATELMAENGKENLSVYITEIHFAIAN